MPADLSDAARVPLAGAQSIAAMAEAEGFTADDYTVALVSRIGVTQLPFNRQIARMQALAGIATKTSPDNVTADELARHYVLTLALFEKFSLLASDCASSGKARAAGIYMSAAASAQRASLAVLNALETLRQREIPPAGEPLSS